MPTRGRAQTQRQKSELAGLVCEVPLDSLENAANLFASRIGNAIKTVV